VPLLIGNLDARILLYAVVSLTVVRMVPVAIGLAGSHLGRRTALFIGWFGPRGLASIVFALMLEEDGGVTNAETVMTVAFVTVGLSVLLHGVTAAPLADRYASWFASHPPEGERSPEARAAPEIPWRRHIGAPRA